MISYIFAALALILDQITKLYASRGIPLDTGIKPLIPGVLQMTHVRNTGAAFGFLSGSKWLLLGFLVVFTAVVALLIWKGVVRTGFGRFSLLLLLAGALGNGLDRVLYGYVVDMFELLFLPNVIFNLADCFITVGAVLFCVHVILFKTHREDDEDYDEEEEDEEEDELPRRGLFGRRRREEEDDEEYEEPVRAPRPAAQRPAAAAQRPAAATQRPAAPAQRPAAPAQRPAAPTQRPAAATQRPAAPAQRPAALAQRPAAPAQRPAASVQRPAVPAQRPAAQPRPATAAPAKSGDEFDLDSILAEFK